jgi:hypothetical protein
VQLRALSSEIAVYRNGAGASAEDPAFKESPEEIADFVGLYELVEPIGPETPVYISAKGSRS